RGGEGREDEERLRSALRDVPARGEGGSVRGDQGAARAAARADGGAAADGEGGGEEAGRGDDGRGRASAEEALVEQEDGKVGRKINNHLLIFPSSCDPSDHRFVKATMEQTSSNPRRARMGAEVSARATLVASGRPRASAWRRRARTSAR